MSIVKLRVKSNYQSLGHDLKAGQVIEVGATLAEFFQRDAPGVFEVFEPKPEPEAKAMDEPPIDKMVRKPKAKK